MAVGSHVADVGPGRPRIAPRGRPPRGRSTTREAAAETAAQEVHALSGRRSEPSTARRQRRVLLLLALGLLLTVSVLRSPLDVLALLTPRATDPGEQDAHSMSRVEGDVATRSDVEAGGTPATDAGPGTAQAAPDSTQEHADGHADGRWGAPGSRPTASLFLEELRGGWRVESGIDEATALAVVAGHAWAARRGLVTRGPGGSGGAIVTVEAVERPGALHGVVTLLIASESPLVLTRLAVPVHLTPGGPAVAGAPWPLPSPTLTDRPLPGTPIGDEQLLAAARQALERIGIPGERMVALETTDGWPFIARLDDDTDGHPWLRWHVDRFVVAGLPLDAVGNIDERPGEAG